MLSALIIRPEGKCQQTVGMFTERGIEAHGLPLMTVEVIESTYSQVIGSLTSSNKPDIVIVTSTYAAQFLIDAMTRQDWSEQIKVICIGESTAAMFEPINVATQAPELATSEGLLSMDDLLDVKNKHIAIIKGVGGRTLLNQGLCERGAHVVHFDCYERLLNIAAVEQFSHNSEHVDCVVATSGELIDLAVTYLDDTWCLKTWVVVSDRTAQVARSKGIKDIVISPSARNLDLYSTCKKL